MQQRDESQKVAIFAAIVFVLFGSYVSYALFLTGQSSDVPLAQGVAAKDGEDNDSEDSNSEDSNDDEDDNSQSEDNKSETKAEKAAKEAEKKKREAAREAAKRSSNSGRGGSGEDLVNGVKLRGDGTVDDDQELSEAEDTELSEADSDEDSESGDDEAMFKDKAKTLERINKKLAQAEEKILEKQAEGVDVTAALAALALAKEKATGVDALFAANELDKVKDLTKETERLAHTARGKVLHAAERVTKDVAKVDKRIGQTKRKIAELTAAGGDGVMYTERLSAIETEWADVKAKIKAGGDEALAALVSVETIERRVKSVKSAVEGALIALGVSDDDEFETEHVTEVADASDEIDDLAEIEEETDNEDHSDLKRLTQAHRADAARVVALKQKFESRSTGMRQLFGDDRGSLDELRLVINKNTERLQAMEAVAAEVEDTELGTMMEKRIAELKEQNAKLQTFVDAQPVTSGLFGWLFNWF